MNALKNDKVGEYLNANFASSYQKVGTFRVANGRKQGGNVASYFCTADGRVVHIVAGPVDAATLLREARWAVETYKMAQLESGGSTIKLAEFLRNAHAERLLKEHRYDLRAGAKLHGRPPLNSQGKVHQLLASKPLPKIQTVYRYAFETILGQKVSTAPVEER